jgi:hypothetical protein
VSTSPITLTPQIHRFFNQLATAQAATAAYIIGNVAQAGGDVTFPRGTFISQVCFTRPQEEVQFEPAEVLDPISQDHVWPSEIHLTFRPGYGRPPAYPNPDAVQLLMASLYEHAFVTYFEKNLAAMFAKHRGKRNWPGILNFGRIVRNAFAHGGTVNITDSIPGAWGGISYSEATNGRRVLYNDLSVGDLTLLMLEMDAQF